MIILGIDPGSYHCGYAVIDARFNPPTYIDCGTIDISKKKDLPQRILEIVTTLQEIIAEFGITHAAIEDIYSGPYPRAGLVLSHVRGAIMYLLASQTIPLSIYPTKIAKKAVTGMGSAKKEQVQKIISSRFKLTQLPSLDASDALAISYTHFLLFKK